MNKFDHDLNTFFALIFHEISLSALVILCYSVSNKVLKNQSWATLIKDLLNMQYIAI